jgi:PKD repeat protein
MVKEAIIVEIYRTVCLITAGVQVINTVTFVLFIHQKRPTEIYMIARRDQDAVTPTISVIMIIVMVTILAVIIYSFIYGLPGGLVKSAYIAVETSVEEADGVEYIAIKHRNGDLVFLNGSGATGGPLIDIDVSYSGSGRTLATADTPITWSAGQTLYLYNTTAGPKITPDRSTAAAGEGFGYGDLSVVIVDSDAEVLVYGTTVSLKGGGPSPVDPLLANFTANTTSGYLPLTVQFTDLSTGIPNSWSWNFGEGNTSTLQSPIYTYASTGAFTVSLTASNPNGSSIATKENYILVINQSVTPPVADFTANITEGDIPLTVQFTDTSTGNPDSWEWHFGDGVISVEQHPIYTYTVAGYYNVSLKAANDAGNNTITKVNFIHAKGFVDYVIEEGVFVYGNVLNFNGDNVNGPGSTVVVTGGLSTADINPGASINVTTIYIDGDVNLDGGSAGLGTSTNPGNIYVNGKMNLNGGSRNIYGDAYVAGDTSIRGVIIHGNFYINGNLELGNTGYDDFIFSESTRLYYNGTFKHYFNDPSLPEVQYILERCIHQATVPGFDMPDQEIPATKAADWYAARGYVSGGVLTNNMKISADSYSFEPAGSMDAQNVVIIARDGDITLKRLGGSVTGIFFAPKGKVTFIGDSLEGLVIARDGFFVESGGTQVTFKNLDQYIGDPNDYPF